jgi:putative PIN family toxin of toxin-antitoxin system
MARVPKIVLDTTIILQAVLYPTSSAGKIFEYLLNEQAVGYLSSRLKEEYEDILYRPTIREKYSAVTEETASKALNFISFYTEEISITPSYVIYERDRKDEPSINLCIAVKADFLIARDRDLLDLNKDRDFKLLYPFLQIITPEEFLKFLQDEDKENPE